MPHIARQRVKLLPRERTLVRKIIRNLFAKDNDTKQDIKLVEDDIELNSSDRSSHAPTFFTTLSQQLLKIAKTQSMQLRATHATIITCQGVPKSLDFLVRFKPGGEYLASEQVKNRVDAKGVSDEHQDGN